MIILVINSGSSSVKFTCFDMDAGTRLAGGLVERIGLEGTTLHYSNNRDQEISRQVEVADTEQAVGLAASILQDVELGVVKKLEDIKAVGHRIVHGGEKIADTVLIDDRVKSIIEECIELAPLHNPPNLEGVDACERIFPGVPHVGVFDTAFHAAMPPQAYLYGLPYSLYKEDKIRRYGFHGTSHKYVSAEAARFLGAPIENLKIVTCHLGNGCSISAVDSGKCVDTSMGLTPLEGLIMGTRCGDLDPAIVYYLMEHKKLDFAGINDLLNKKSGLLGLAGIGSSDLRDILKARDEGNEQADMAFKAFIYRVKKYIGSYSAVMGGMDAIVFTAGIGENSPLVRQMVCEGMEGIGVTIDKDKNEKARKEDAVISRDDGRVKVLVVPTDEEREIARQTMGVLDGRP